jgi:hypothetical protein
VHIRDAEAAPGLVHAIDATGTAAAHPV